MPAIVPKGQRVIARRAIPGHGRERHIRAACDDTGQEGKVPSESQTPNGGSLRQSRQGPFGPQAAVSLRSLGSAAPRSLRDTGEKPYKNS
ncbi:MAG: hypothetical protein ACRD5K_19820 [Candidatus Acidiferrales bacterium]